MSAKGPQLHNAYALKTPEDSIRLYADWAKTYDADFVDHTGYVLHLAVVDAFVRAQGQGPVLDLGAGTGICGAALAKHAIGPIHGTDISQGMLDVAAQKGVYDTLFSGDILQGLDQPAGTFPGIISAGTFTLGHVGPDGLDEVMRLLAPGGLAVISVRDVHFDTAGFAQKIDTLRPLIAKMEQPTTRIYAQNSTADHATDRAVLLHLWRA